MKVTENYQTFVDAMAGISLPEVVYLYTFCERMHEALNMNDIRGVHCDQDYDEEMRGINKLISRLLTDKICPRCGDPLYVSDLPDYDYVCPTCDENFYEIEIPEKYGIKTS